MRKIKFDCPLSFIRDEVTFNQLLSKRNLCKIDDNKEAEIVVVNPGTDNKLSSEYFSTFDLEKLKYVLTPSTGVNHIDTKFLKSKNIVVYSLLDNREGLNTITASSEFTWLHIMNAVRKFSIAISSIDEWRSSKNEDLLRSNELCDKKIGIIGLGRIGTNITKYAKVFNMQISYYDPYVCNNEINRVDQLSQLCDNDIIVISCYLTDETQNLITWDVFKDIKEDTIIVNTARGEVIDEEYMCHLIMHKNIKFSADVLKNEQDIAKLKMSKLYKLSKTKPENVTITPHVAGATAESQTKALTSVLDLL